MLPKGGGKIQHNRLAHWLPPTKCNCCCTVPTPLFSEHCVQDMNERSISYYSAHLPVCNTPACRSNGGTPWRHWSSPKLGTLKATNLANKQTKKKQKKGKYSHYGICLWSRAWLFFRECWDQVAEQHQVWNETRIPQEGCCGKCAVKWDSGGRFATPCWLRQLFAREKNENNNKK